MNGFQVSGGYGEFEEWINLDNVISYKIVTYRPEEHGDRNKAVTFVFSNGSEAEYFLNSEQVTTLRLSVSMDTAK